MAKTRNKDVWIGLLFFALLAVLVTFLKNQLIG